MLSRSLILRSIKKLDRRLNLEYHVEHYLEAQNVLQKDAPECTSDSYKKAQEKMKQRTLECTSLNKDTSTSREKGRMHSNLKT